MNKFRQDVPTVQAAASDKGYSEKQFLHSFIAGAVLPLVQALITAILLAVLWYACAVIFFDAMDALKISGGVFIVALVVCWLSLQKRWLSLTSIETLLNVDLNKDKVIGKVEPVRVRVELQEVKDNGHYQVEIVDLPGSPEKLRTFSQGLMAGTPASEKYWTGSGKLFSTMEFRTLKNEMVRRGLMAYVSAKDPRQGHELTKAGRAVARRLASLSPTVEGEVLENA